jgi:hypothetical protein
VAAAAKEQAARDQAAWEQAAKEETKTRLRAVAQGLPGTPPDGRPQGIAVGEPHGRPRTPPPPDVRTMSWLSADYSVELVAGTVLTGRGSLMGTNNATLVAALDATNGPVIEKAWAAGLPDAKSQARITVEAATEAAAGNTSSTGSVESTSTGDSDGSYSHTSTRSEYQDTHVGTRIRIAQPLELILGGPLTLPTSVRTSHRTELSF